MLLQAALGFGDFCECERNFMQRTYPNWIS